MNSTKKAARVAGLLYLVASIFGVFSLVYIPSLFPASGDATATANKIRTSEFLFRGGIVGNLVGTTIFIFVALALYRLLKGVNKKHALWMLILILLSVPISFLNELNQIAALKLASGADFLSAFDQPQRDALVMAFLNFHNSGYLLAEVFWGLWLFPFGALVYRSGFLPRILGVLLMPAGCAYVAVVFTALLFPAYRHPVGRVAEVLQFGELPIIFWLLIMGAKDQPLEDLA